MDFKIAFIVYTKPIQRIDVAIVLFFFLHIKQQKTFKYFSCLDRIYR